VEDDAAEIPGGDADILKACLTHERGKLVRRRKPRDGAGKIRVGLAIAGDGPADARKDIFEIEAEESRHGAANRFGEFEDAHFPTLLEHARDFAETLIVTGEIAKAEGRCDEVETRIGKREMQGVGGGEDGAVAIAARLFLRAFEHAFDEISADHRRAQRGGIGALADAVEREGKIARATAEVEDAGFRPPKDMLEPASGAAAPDAIKREGEEMVQEVVARHDSAKHFADARGGFALVARSFGARAGKLFESLGGHGHARRGAISPGPPRFSAMRRRRD